MAIEFSGAAATALAAFFLMRTRDRSADADANAQWLATVAKHPRVDVLICSYNEEQAIVERTIVGAMAMSYPNFRVWMLDDSRREWLKDLCATLNCGYIARATNEHAKAGNINNALRILGDLPDPPQFVSVLDADFVPTPRFLTRAMALFRDEAIGIVQTPQHFINPDPIQSNLAVSQTWPDEQRYFFDIVLPAKDAWKAAICCGTSSVIRFRAADGDRRHSHRFRHRGLFADAQAEGDRALHRLSERTADVRPRARGAEGICDAAGALVPRLHADRAGAQRSVLAQQGVVPRPFGAA